MWWRLSSTLSTVFAGSKDAAGLSWWCCGVSISVDTEESAPNNPVLFSGDWSWHTPLKATVFICLSTFRGCLFAHFFLLHLLTYANLCIFAKSWGSVVNGRRLSTRWWYWSCCSWLSDLRSLSLEIQNPVAGGVKSPMGSPFPVQKIACP